MDARAEGTTTAATDLYWHLLAAWNRRDPAGYAALFPADATIVGFDGSTMTGSTVRDELGAIFEHHETAPYVAKVKGARELAPGVVLVEAIAGMIPPGERELAPGANAIQVLVAVLRSDRWRVELFQNTPAAFHGRPELVEQHTAELAGLVPVGLDERDT